MSVPEPCQFQQAWVEALPGVAYVKDAQGRFLYVNEEGREVLGCNSRDEYWLRKPEDFFPEETAAAFTARDEQAFASGKPLKFIQHGISSHNEDCVYDVSVTPMFSPNRERLGILVHCQDITERYFNEQELEHRNNLLRTLLDTSPDLLLVKDTKSNYTYMNKAARDYHRLGEQDIDGLSDWDLFDHETARTLRGRDRQVLATNRPMHIIEEGTAQNGNPHAFDILIMPVPGQSGPRGVAVMCRDTTARYHKEQLSEQERDSLRAETLTDPLTGIANRRCWEQTMTELWHQHRRQGESLGVILCDVDKFKAYNDHYGHQRGDDALVRIAQALQNALKRSGDLLVRFGGEEFAIALPHVNQQGLDHVIESLRESIEHLGLPHAGCCSGRLTVSLGGALAYPSDEETVKGVLSRADMALYQAKSAGRNCWHIAK